METIRQLSLSDFDYDLPKELIAQQPVKNRSEARLLVLDRAAGSMRHRQFSDLSDYLAPGDCLVLNDTKVLKARLFARKKTGGRVEILLHKALSGADWEVLLKPGGRVKEGSEIFVGENGSTLRAEVLDAPRADSGLRRIRFHFAGDLTRALDELGRVPLPPYIDRPDAPEDREFYQTVFARKAGAVASPTAGLHFDEPLLAKIRAKGVEIVFITLHVGYGTFQPVAAEDLGKHDMHSEEFEVTQEAAAAINRALSAGSRVMACGTTVARTLETQAEKSPDGHVRMRAGRGDTRLFIYPPYEFKALHGLVTNFHLPRTTLLMLVSALCGRDLLMRAYREAVAEKYRFYSYGDAMVIL